ncbi:MAG: sensor histidine kinase [Flavipsychrobacter sp.]
MLEGLGDNEVFKFYEDKKHRLWLSTYNGSSCYIKDGIVHNTSNDSLLARMPVLAFINSMCDPDSNHLYIGYYRGQLLLLNDTVLNWINKAEYWQLTLLYPVNGYVKAIAANQSLNIKASKLISVAPRKFNGPQNAFSSGDKMLIADYTGVKIYKGDSLLWNLQSTSITINNVIHLYLDSAGYLFASCKDGLRIVNIKTGVQRTLLKNLSITCVARDIEGNYWVSTIGDGIFCLNADFNNIRSLSNVIDAKMFYTENKQLYYIANNKLFELSKGQFNNIAFLNNKFTPLYSNAAWLFYTSGSFFCVCNKQTNILDQTHGLKYIYCYGTDKLVLCGFDQFYKVSIASNKYRKIDSVLFRNKIIQCRFDSATRTIYVIDKSALYVYNIDNDQLTTIDSFQNGLPASLSLYGDYILVTTNNKSVFVYKKASFRKNIYLQKDIVYYSFDKMGDNRMLINTNKGFYILDSFKGDLNAIHPVKVEYPFHASNLFDIYPYYDSAICNVGGKLFIIHCSLLNKHIAHPVFYIKKITAEGKIFHATNITLGHRSEYDVQIELDMLSFNGDPGYYEYRIINHDTTSWLHAEGGILTIRLNNYGNNYIEIRAANEGGAISRSQFITVKLLPPFYLSWWGITLEILGLMALLLIGIRIYNRKKSRQFAHELEYMQLENKAINALLNPHFIFNSINNIQNLVAQGDAENANQYLALLSRLIRQNIENLQFNVIPLDKELSLVRNYIYLQNLRFRNLISLEINKSFSSDNICIPPLLIQTFIENSVVHGKKKGLVELHINVELELHEDSYLLITITDDGYGYQPSAQSTNKTSLGISFVRKRLERLSAFYKVDYLLHIENLSEGDTTGTRVQIKICSKFQHSIAPLLPTDFSQPVQ